MIRQVVLGERDPAAAEVQAALAAFPELAAELGEFAAIQRQLDAVGDDAAAVEQQARADIRSDDHRRVQQLVDDWHGRVAPGIEPGNHEATAGVIVDRSGATWSIDPGVQLPPGASYMVTLEIDGGPAFAAQPFVRPIRLPPAWQRAIDGAAAAELLVEQSEVSLRRRVKLR